MYLFIFVRDTRYLCHVYLLALEKIDDSKLKIRDSVRLKKARRMIEELRVLKIMTEELRQEEERQRQEDLLVSTKIDLPVANIVLSQE